MDPYFKLNSETCTDLGDGGAWRNASRQEFDKCNRDSNDPELNKYYEDKNSEGKFVKNKNKLKPYCVRCEADMDTDISLRQLVDKLERLDKLVTTNIDANTDKAKKEIELAALTREFNKKFSNGNNRAPSSTTFAMPPQGCASQPSPVSWGNPKSTDAGVLVSESGDVVWNRPYAVAHKKNKGKYCADISDAAVQRDGSSYHHLAKLDAIKNTASWPRDQSTGKSVPTHEVYETAALCAQLNEQAECTSTSATVLPLGNTKSQPGRHCNWRDDVNIPKYFGECVPNYVSMRGSYHGSDKSDMDKWWAEFSKHEKELAKKNNTKFDARWYRQ
jgi:hypothetical protein